MSEAGPKGGRSPLTCKVEVRGILRAQREEYCLRRCGLRPPLRANVRKCCVQAQRLYDYVTLVKHWARDPLIAYPTAHSVLF